MRWSKESERVSLSTHLNCQLSPLFHDIELTTAAVVATEYHWALLLV